MSQEVLGMQAAGWRALGRVVERRRRLLLLYGLMALAALPGLWRIETDNSPSAFFVRDSAVLQRYDRFQRLFGRDRSLRVVAQGEGLWTRRGLAWLADLERQTSRWTGVAGAVGLYASHRWDFSEWPPDPDALRTMSVGDPLDRNMGWIDRQGRVATTLLALNRLEPERQTRLLERLEAYLAEAPREVRTHLVGLPLVNRAFDREVDRWMSRFFPLLILLAAALLAAAFRRVVDVLLPLILVGVCQTVLFGAMGYAGVRLNLVLVLLAPLMFVISLATAVHILVRYRQLAGAAESPARACLATYRDKAWPTFWTGVTTAAGFGSLAVAEVPPVRQFGIWSGLGMLLVTIAAFTLYPALLACFGGKGPAGGGGFLQTAGRLGAKWADSAVRRRGRVFALFAVSAALLAAGGWRLGLDSNALHYLRPENPARANLESLEEAGVGAVAAEIALETDPSRTDLESPDSLRRLSGLSETLRRLPWVTGAVGPGDVVESAARRVSEASHPGDSRLREALRQMRERPETRPLLGASLSRGGAAARLTLLLKMRGHGDLQPVFDEAIRRAREAFPEAEAALTGQYALVLAAQRSLLQTMLLSLTLTLLAVTAVFRILTGGFRLTLLLLLPNLWPVVFVLGGLGWVGFPLDSTTVMIASVALGLAVDDTLHALGAFRRRSDLAPSAASVEALRETAPGHLLTTLVLVTGFAACGFSDFVPVSRFGAMTAAALAGALAADLWLVPALLSGAVKQPSRL